MAFTLTMQFGGLCLFLEQAKAGPRGLFVLMPEMEHHGMVHKPLLAFDEKHLDPRKAGKRKEIPLKDKVVMLRDLITPTSKQGLSEEIANASRYGERRVCRHWTTDALPAKGLASRIELDLGLVVEPIGLRAQLLIEYKKNGTAKQDRVPKVGLAEIVIPVAADSLTILNETLTPVGGEMRLFFGNVLNGDLDEKPIHHPKGEKQYHFSAYYQLLCPPDGPTPTPEVDEEFNPGPPGSEFRILYIDPFRCTLGGGCEEEEEDC